MTTQPARRPARANPARRLGDVAFTLAAGLLLVAALFLVLLPRTQGGLSLTVLSGSMEPRLHPGDIVVTKGVDPARAASLGVGDIITFLPYPDDPTLVTHRIIGVGVDPDGARSFVTQGDANPDPDPWGPVPAAHVRGELWYVVPKLGYLREAVGTHSVAMVSGAAAVLIGAGAVLLLSSLRRRPASAPARRREDA